MSVHVYTRDLHVLKCRLGHLLEHAYVCNDIFWVGEIAQEVVEAGLWEDRILQTQLTLRLAEVSSVADALPVIADGSGVSGVVGEFSLTVERHHHLDETLFCDQVGSLNGSDHFLNPRLLQVAVMVVRLEEPGKVWPLHVVLLLVVHELLKDAQA